MRGALSRRLGGGGGLPARRAVVRWAWRLFRREWRQQVLVVALLSLAVTLAVGGATAAYNFAPRRDAEFGSADHRLVFALGEAEPDAIDTYLASAEEWFGAIDPIRQRNVAIPGSTETLELRAQDPDGPFSGPMLALREGRYPTREGEVAPTDDVAGTFDVSIGDTLALGDRELDVVGLAENPNDLHDEFALVAPSSAGPVDQLTVLVAGSEDRVTSFPADHDPGPGYFESRGVTEKDAAAAGVLAASTVVLLLVCLVAAAGFVVVAQRRLRQMGMLAAVGATPKQLRLVVVANGVVVGGVAAIVGSITGLAAWSIVAPLVEEAAGHRIGGFDAPWPLLGLAMLLAVVASAAAAWWPARTVARVPVTQALSGRPPQPHRSRRSLVLAVLLLGTGVACLMWGIDATKDKGNAGLTIVGVLAIPLGIVLLCPLAVRALAPLAGRLPIAARLALRDLARYQARAGAALAAISLGLGISVAVVLAASAAEYTTDEGNLSDRQLLVRIDVGNEVGAPVDVPEQTAAELADDEATVNRIAAALGDPSVLALDVPQDPGAEEPRGGGEVLHPPVVLGIQIDEDTFRDRGPLYVATPTVLTYLGLEAASIDPGTDVLTPLPGPLFYIGPSIRNTEVENLQTIEAPAYTAVPRSLITPEAVRRHGWESARAAWLVEAAQPLTEEQLADARDLAAGARMSVETRRGQEGLTQLRTGATVVGMLLGIGILAMTVGLIRSEAGAELRTLAASGASGRTRRSITGVTSGVLAFLGALLGTVGAYAGLGAGYNDDIGALGSVPVVNLAAIAVGLPLLAAAAGWLLAGREPPALSRTPME